MRSFVTKHFFKWALKQRLSDEILNNAIEEVKSKVYEVALGGDLFKKRIQLLGRGKRGGARTIICYKKDSIAIFIHGFAKNEKDNLSSKELRALKEFAKILIGLKKEEIELAIKNGDFREI